MAAMTLSTLMLKVFQAGASKEKVVMVSSSRDGG